MRYKDIKLLEKEPNFGNLTKLDPSSPDYVKPAQKVCRAFAKAVKRYNATPVRDRRGQLQVAVDVVNRYLTRHPEDYDEVMGCTSGYDEIAGMVKD